MPLIFFYFGGYSLQKSLLCSGAIVMGLGIFIDGAILLLEVFVLFLDRLLPGAPTTASMR